MKNKKLFRILSSVITFSLALLIVVPFGTKCVSKAEMAFKLIVFPLFGVMMSFLMFAFYLKDKKQQARYDVTYIYYPVLVLQGFLLLYFASLSLRNGTIYWIKLSQSYNAFYSAVADFILSVIVLHVANLVLYRKDLSHKQNDVIKYTLLLNAPMLLGIFVAGSKFVKKYAATIHRFGNSVYWEGGPASKVYLYSPGKVVLFVGLFGFFLLLAMMGCYFYKIFKKEEAKKDAKSIDYRYKEADTLYLMYNYSKQKLEDAGFDLNKKLPVDKEDERNILLKVVDVDIHFKVKRRIVKACNHLNFVIYRGETFGLVGESGSGKTTISRAILGINKLTNGKIIFKGRDISKPLSRKEKMQVKKGIQMIFQDPASSLNERANVDYIISEGLYNFHLYKDKQDRLAKVYKILDEVGLLPEHLSRYPHEFSGGQRQRIGIARALVVQPELVLADEPISALDVSIRAQILNLLKKLQQELNLTYLFIAHDLSIIKYISDRIGVMHQGYIVELGKAEDVYNNPIHPYTKSLLTAIPQPDPHFKFEKRHIVYNKGDMDYEKCEWLEVTPGHYVLGSEELIKKWLKQKI